MMQTDFTNITCHEVRTLTHAILGYSEILQMNFEENNRNKNYDDDDDDAMHYNNTAKKILHVIVRSAKELQRSIRDISDPAELKTTHQRSLEIQQAHNHLVQSSIYS